MPVTFLTNEDKLIESVILSEDDGGENVVTFHDGTQLIVKNGRTGKDGVDCVEVPAQLFDIPVLILEGDTTAMDKDNAVTLTYYYGDRAGTLTCKWQGSSSLSYPKKNYTIKFDNAFEAKAGWGEQKKYCLKANYIDHSHARNICSCKLWGQIVKSRANVPSELAGLTNGGAIDGFPVWVKINGEDMGLYTFNIPKDGWMFGNPKAIVCADNRDSGATAFYTLATLNGDFKLEYVEDENDADWVLTSLNTAIQAVLDEWKEKIEQYFDVPSIIDYYIHCVDEDAIDATDKNYLLVTFDGVKWYMSAYDRDTTYGIDWDGSGFRTPNSGVTFEHYANSNALMWRMYTMWKTELKARAIELRDSIKSEANVMTVFTNFTAGIPSQLLDREARRWPYLPSTSASNLAQILNWYRLRRQFIDKEIASWE